MPSRQRAALCSQPQMISRDRLALALLLTAAVAGCAGPATVDAQPSGPDVSEQASRMAEIKLPGRPTQSVAPEEMARQAPGARCIVETTDPKRAVAGTLLRSSGGTIVLRDATEIHASSSPAARRPAAGAARHAGQRIFPELAIPLADVKVVHLFGANPQSQWRPAGGWKPAQAAAASDQQPPAPLGPPDDA